MPQTPLRNISFLWNTQGCTADLSLVFTHKFSERKKANHLMLFSLFIIPIILSFSIQNISLNSWKMPFLSTANFTKFSYYTSFLTTVRAKSIILKIYINHYSVLPIILRLVPVYLIYRFYYNYHIFLHSYIWTDRVLNSLKKLFSAKLELKKRCTLSFLFVRDKVLWFSLTMITGMQKTSIFYLTSLW